MQADKICAERKILCRIIHFRGSSIVTGTGVYGSRANSVTDTRRSSTITPRETDAHYHPWCRDRLMEGGVPLKRTSPAPSRSVQINGVTRFITLKCHCYHQYVTSLCCNFWPRLEYSECNHCIYIDAAGTWSRREGIATSVSTPRQALESPAMACFLYCIHTDC